MSAFLSRLVQRGAGVPVTGPVPRSAPPSFPAPHAQQEPVGKTSPGEFLGEAGAEGPPEAEEVALREEAPAASFDPPAVPPPREVSLTEPRPEGPGRVPRPAKAVTEEPDTLPVARDEEAAVSFRPSVAPEALAPAAPAARQPPAVDSLSLTAVTVPPDAGEESHAPVLPRPFRVEPGREEGFEREGRSAVVTPSIGRTIVMERVLRGTAVVPAAVPWVRVPVRASARPEPLPYRPSAPGAEADEGPPRVEVRIGTVEVQVAEPPAPGARRPARGFAEYALTRRYLDRGW